MRVFRSVILSGLAAAALSTPALAASNIIPGNVSSVSVSGTAGVLRDATWSSGSTPSSTSAPFTGTPQADGTQWNHGSFWWDQDPSVNTSPVSLTVDLNKSYKITQFTVQADDNDTYLLQYWNGTSWATAWNIPEYGSYGLTTRVSGLLGPITTDALRFTATGGDNYYALGQLEAVGVPAGVPEPASWALMILGVAGTGAALRLRRSAVITA